MTDDKYGEARNKQIKKGLEDKPDTLIGNFRSLFVPHEGQAFFKKKIEN